MEVHHHPHVEKKKFKEYFLEFLMIFLAVTMGFIAENIREKFAEKKGTKEYLESYRDELVQQQQLLAHYKQIFQRKIILCDSIQSIFFTGQENAKIDAVERQYIPAITLVDIPFSTSSYDQMVSSGALRYIHNIELRDSMAAYKGAIEVIKNYNARMIQAIISLQSEVIKFFDYRDMVGTDTTMSYDLQRHVPAITPFTLSPEQRKLMVGFYEYYIIQAQSDLRRMRMMAIFNEHVRAMVDGELKK